MGALAHLVKIKPGDNLDSFLTEGFNSVSDRLEGALSRLMKESDAVQSSSLTSAVEGVVNAVADSHRIFSEGVVRLSEEVQEVKTDVGSSVQTLSQQIHSVTQSIAILPTSIPETDLSGLMNGISNVHKQVKAIPEVKVPDMKKDFAALEKRMTAMEKRLAKRVHNFEIERDVSNLVKSIKVKTA